MQHFNNPSFFIPGPAGQLEASASHPGATCKKVVVICHPHPLYQGSMDNKVVTSAQRAFQHLGLATLRFNFRGVGKSAGDYGEITGELQDAQAVIDWVKSILPEHKLWLCGFSFGAYIAAEAAQHHDTEQLISIAPPVHHMDFANLNKITCPWLVIQGDQDEVVPPADVLAWAKQPPSPLKLIVLENVGHFFHGHLVELRELLENKLQDQAGR